MKKRPFAEIDGGEPSPASATGATAATYTDLDLGRVSNLERMIGVLKSMHSSLRRDYWTSPPTCDEIRMYHLILVHVNSCISLFHIERSSSHRALPLFPKPKQGEEEEEEEVADALNEKVGVLYIYPGLLASTLVDGRNASLKPEQDPLFRNLPLMKAMVEDNARNPESKRKLRRVLSGLEGMGRARGYAPPLGGREIECYREIRNLAVFSIVFVYSNVDLHVGTKATPRCRPPKIPHAPYDRVIHAPLGHGLAAGYEMIPVHRSFFDMCRRHLSTIEDADVDDPSDNDVDVEGEVDISNDGGVEAEDNGGGGGRRPVMKSRLECLQIIVSQFIRIASLRCSPNPPTKEEVRLYAQIAEHVYSSIWLFDNSEDIRTGATGTRCRELIDVTDAFYNSPDDTGCNNNDNIREQYLGVIVSYLDAVKSSCLAAIPTVEEMGYYEALSRGLDHSFMSCSISADHCVEISQTTQEEMRASLKSQLVSVYKMQLNLYEEAMRESDSIAQLLQLSADGREIDYFSDDDVVVKKVKDFLGEQICETKLKQLNRLIVILIEICHFESCLGRLLEEATWNAREQYLLGKDYEKVARELHLARCVNSN